MIKLTDQDKTLVIPSALGNQNRGGGGSGEGISREEAYEIAEEVTTSAITEYDTELQADLEDMRENISGNTSNIEALSAITSGLVTNADVVYDYAVVSGYSESELQQFVFTVNAYANAGKRVFIKKSDAGNIVWLSVYQHSDTYVDFFGQIGNVQTVVSVTAIPGVGSFFNVSTRDIIMPATENYAGIVKIGSGLTMSGETLSVSDSIFEPITGQITGITGQITELSGATQSIEQSLGDYATTAVTDAMETEISGLTVNIQTLSGLVKEDVILDIAEINSMSYANRKVLWDETYAKLIAGHRVYAKGAVGNNLTTFAYLPLEKYIPETDPSTHSGGYMYFTVKDYDANKYLGYSFNSAGNISGTIVNGERFQIETIYTMSPASSSAMGGIRVGTGLTIDGNAKLSIDAGDGLAFSGNTLVVSGKQDAEYVLILSTLEEANFTQADTQAISDLFTYLADKTAETANVRAVNTNDDTIIFRLIGFSDSYAEFTYFSVEIGAIGFVVDPNGGCTVTEFDSQQVLFDLTLKQDELNASSGISIDAQNNISVKVGDGLGFSGDTLVLSGATGGPTEYYINNMTQAERAALYLEISGITGGDNNSANVPQIFSNYRFYVYHDMDGQKWCQAFFSNWENQWVDELQDSVPVLWIIGMKPYKASYEMNIVRVVAAIYPDGSVQYYDAAFPNIDNAANDIELELDSNGRMKSENLGRFGSLNKFNRFVLRYADENIQNNWCTAPLEYFYRKTETIDGNDKLVEYVGGTINVNGTKYRGAWHFIEWEWGEWVSPDTWTTV